jgi:signal peptidase II
VEYQNNALSFSNLHLICQDLRYVPFDRPLRSALAGCTLLADQLSKLAIAGALPFNTYGPPGHVPIIPGFFNLVHVGNTGAAWSLLSGRSELLALLAAVALVSIFWFRRQLLLEQPKVQTAFGLLCGGIVGNLIDRMAYGHVVDFLDFHFGSYIYPTFNIADSGIVCGVGYYVLLNMVSPKPAGGTGESSPSGGDDSRG